MALSLRSQATLLSSAHSPVFSAVPWFQQHRQHRLRSHEELYLTTRRFASHSHSHSHSNSHSHSPSSKSHARPSSSAQPTLKGSVPSTSSTATTSVANDVNPPPSTRPADLNLPDPLSASAPPIDKLKRYIALGRAYLSFYKTGLKNVYHNYRASLPIRRSLGLTSYLPIPLHPKLPPSSSVSHGPNTTSSKGTNTLSRSSFQLIRRAAYDVHRMIPFTLILLICGELTPFAVLALGNAVTPRTCRVPAQQSKARATAITRKRAALASHAAALSGSVTPAPMGSAAEMVVLAGQFADEGWVGGVATGEEVLRACAVFGLAGSHLRPAWLGSGVYRGRLRRYVGYLGVDDGLIRRGGGVAAMEGVEVTIAVEERGGWGVSEGMEGWEAERVERRWLEAWLERRGF